MQQDLMSSITLIILSLHEFYCDVKSSAKYMRRFHALRETPPSIITSGAHNVPAFNVKKRRQT